MLRNRSAEIRIPNRLLDEIESKTTEQFDNQQEQIHAIVDALKQLMKQERERMPIGFRMPGETNRLN